MATDLDAIAKELGPIAVEELGGKQAIGGVVSASEAIGFAVDIKNGNIDEAAIKGAGMAGAAGGTAAGSLIGLPPSVTAPIGKFIGEKIGGAIVDGFNSIFGSSDEKKKRAEFERKVREGRKALALASKVLAATGYITHRLQVNYKLRDLLIKAQGVTGYAPIASAKAFTTTRDWLDELGARDLRLERPEWFGAGGKILTEKIKADPRAGEKVQQNLDELDRAARRVIARIAALAVANAALAEKRKVEKWAADGERRGKLYLKHLTDPRTLEQGKRELRELKRTALRSDDRGYRARATIAYVERALRFVAAVKKRPPKLRAGPSAARARPRPRPAPTPAKAAPMPRRAPVTAANSRALTLAAPKVRGALTRTFGAPRLRRPPLAWRPLTARGAAFIKRYARAVRRPAPDVRGLIIPGRDVGALEAGGSTYIVEGGDSAWAIAKKLTGSGLRWKELVKANPRKSTTADGNFKYLSTGERLTLPVSWQKAPEPAQTILERAQKETAPIAIPVSIPKLGLEPAAPAPAPTPKQAPPSVAKSPAEALQDGGRRYVVQSGDSAWRITQKLTGDGNRYRELLRANPQKSTTGSPPNFKYLSTGEILNVPELWRQEARAEIERRQKAGTATRQREQVATPEPAARTAERPAPSGPTTRPIDYTPPPVIIGKPGVSDDPRAIEQAKGMLIAWGRTDGAGAAGLTDYGNRAEDVGPIWGPRDKFILRSFANWWNVGHTPKLEVNSDLTQAKLDALWAWTEEAAARTRAALPAVPVALPEPVKAPPFAPIEIPETVITEPAPEKKKAGLGIAALVAGMAALFIFGTKRKKGRRRRAA